ncbi:MAG: protein kinase [Deltaproteobacteria bacterium]|nr:protein kinase [Deltaproteobacteria bacterium]
MTTPAGPGTILDGKYRLLHPLGQGGMGVVWAAEHLVLGRRVAVKLLRREFAEDRTNARRFAQEATAACRIGSPHIVAILDFGSGPDGAPYLAMELLSGETLGAALFDRPPMALPRALDIAGQMLAGLGAAHACGIVHRDGKPENVFLTSCGERRDFVKLLDFGLSRVLSGDTATRLTRTGAVLGTPSYMSPEQVMGSRDIDHRSDLWSVAVVLYLALTGRRPFDGPTVADRLAAIVAAAPPPLCAFRPDLDPGLEAAFHRALAREPARRVGSADEFRALLAPFDAGGVSPYETRAAAPASVAACPEAARAVLAGAGVPTAVAAPRPGPSALVPGGAPTAVAIPPPLAPAAPAGPARPAAARRRVLPWVAGAVVLGAALVAVALLILDSGSDGRRSSPPLAADAPSAGADGRESPAAAAPGGAVASPGPDAGPTPPLSAPGPDAVRERYIGVLVETMCWEARRARDGLPTRASEMRDASLAILSAKGLTEQGWTALDERMAPDGASGREVLARARAACGLADADPELAALDERTRVLRLQAEITCSFLADSPRPTATRDPSVPLTAPLVARYGWTTAQYVLALRRLMAEPGGANALGNAAASCLPGAAYLP